MAHYTHALKATQATQPAPLRTAAAPIPVDNVHDCLHEGSVSAQRELPPPHTKANRLFSFDETFSDLKKKKNPRQALQFAVHVCSFFPSVFADSACGSVTCRAQHQIPPATWLYGSLCCGTGPVEKTRRLLLVLMSQRSGRLHNRWKSSRSWPATDSTSRAETVPCVPLNREF